MTVIAVDVPGVLIPKEHGLDGYVRHQVMVSQVPVWCALNADHGPWLIELADRHSAKLVWCSVWNDTPNEKIAGIVGLPRLPFVRVPDASRARRERHVTEYKGRALLDYTWNERIVWFTADRDAPYAMENMINNRKVLRPGPCLVVKVDPDLGLTLADVAQADAWL